MSDPVSAEYIKGLMEIQEALKSTSVEELNKKTLSSFTRFSNEELIDHLHLQQVVQNGKIDKLIIEIQTNWEYIRQCRDEIVKERERIDQLGYRSASHEGNLIWLFKSVKELEQKTVKLKKKKKVVIQWSNEIEKPASCNMKGVNEWEAYDDPYGRYKWAIYEWVDEN